MYENLKERLIKLILENDLGDKKIEVKSSILSVEEAIGKPERNDYPIQKGKESLIQATFMSGKGQAFTDMPREFSGTINEILEMSFINNSDYAIFVAVLNAVLNHLNLIGNTIHCKDEAPIECSKKLVEYIKDQYGNPKVALIGLQPAMLSYLSKDFKVRVTDLDEEMIGKVKSGIIIENGEVKTNEVVEWCDVIVATGSSAANGTLPDFVGKKPVLFFGTTIAGISYMNGYERFCPESK